MNEETRKFLEWLSNPNEHSEEIISFDGSEWKIECADDPIGYPVDIDGLFKFYQGYLESAKKMS
jgi:hypothetical protein